MIQSFIKELEKEKRLNKRTGSPNIIDINYVIERLKDIELDQNELEKLLISYKDLVDTQCDILEDEYKRKKRVKKYLNEDNRDEYDFSRAIILEMLEGDI